jgi:hypothetical protein
VKLVALLVVFAFAIWYGGALKEAIESGGDSWGWYATMIIWPFVLAWFVGNDDDRADFYKIREWILTKLRLR